MEQHSGQRPDLGGRSTVSGGKGAVACEHPRAALAGIRVLDAGGNAADACVAMAATMAIVAPMTTGMGGDAFLLFHESETGRVVGANGSGRTPRSATVEKLKSRGVEEMPERGALTVTVPGAVRLWEDTASSLGRLPLSRLLEPAREAAEEGNPVSEVVARYWKEEEELLGRDEAATETFLPKGRAPESGEMFHQPDLARTIRAVMEGGADAFYEGEVAKNIVRSVQRAGGYLAEEDLASHETTWVEPISTDYRGVKVHEIPPPGQGIAALEMLNILEGYDLRNLPPLSAERIHLEAEAKNSLTPTCTSGSGTPSLQRFPLRSFSPRSTRRSFASGSLKIGSLLGPNPSSAPIPLTCARWTPRVTAARS